MVQLYRRKLSLTSYLTKEHLKYEGKARNFLFSCRAEKWAKMGQSTYGMTWCSFRAMIWQEDKWCASTLNALEMLFTLPSIFNERVLSTALKRSHFVPPLSYCVRVERGTCLDLFCWFKSSFASFVSNPNQLLYNREVCLAFPILLHCG